LDLCVRMDKGGGEGLSQCWHFVDKGEGVNFSRLCVEYFMEASTT